MVGMGWEEGDISAGNRKSTWPITDERCSVTATGGGVEDAVLRHAARICACAHHFVAVGAV